MGTARELLDELQQNGFSLRVDGETLYVAPSDRLTPALRERITYHKSALIAIAQSRAAIDLYRSSPQQGPPPEACPRCQQESTSHGVADVDGRWWWWSCNRCHAFWTRRSDQPDSAPRVWLDAPKGDTP